MLPFFHACNVIEVVPYCAFGHKVLGFVALSGSAGQKIGNLRAQPDYLQQNRRSRKSKTGGLVGRSRFYPALPKAPARSMRQIPESPSTPPFQVKKQQVEALPLSSAVVMSGICRILPDLAQARRGCLSIEAVESSLYLVICI